MEESQKKLAREKKTQLEGTLPDSLFELTLLEGVHCCAVFRVNTSHGMLNDSTPSLLCNIPAIPRVVYWRQQSAWDHTRGSVQAVSVAEDDLPRQSGIPLCPLLF